MQDAARPAALGRLPLTFLTIAFASAIVTAALAALAWVVSFATAAVGERFGPAVTGVQQACGRSPSPRPPDPRGPYWHASQSGPASTVQLGAGASARIGPTVAFSMPDAPRVRR